MGHAEVLGLLVPRCPSLVFLALVVFLGRKVCQDFGYRFGAKSGPPKKGGRSGTPCRHCHTAVRLPVLCALHSLPAFACRFQSLRGILLGPKSVREFCPSHLEQKVDPQKKLAIARAFSPLSHTAVLLPVLCAPCLCPATAKLHEKASGSLRARSRTTVLHTTSPTFLFSECSDNPADNL